MDEWKGTEKRWNDFDMLKQYCSETNQPHRRFV